MCRHPDLPSEVAPLAAHDGAADFIESPARGAAGDLFVEDASSSAGIGSVPIWSGTRAAVEWAWSTSRTTRLSRRVALKLFFPNFNQIVDAAIDCARKRAPRGPIGRESPRFTPSKNDDELYLASDRVAGPTLRALIESGPRKIVRCRAGESAGVRSRPLTQGVVHRD